MSTHDVRTKEDGRPAGFSLSTSTYQVALGRALLLRVPSAVPEHAIATLLFMSAGLDALLELNAQGYRRAPVHISRKVHDASKIVIADFGNRDRTWSRPSHVMLMDAQGRAYCIAKIIDTTRYGPAVHGWGELGAELQFDAQVRVPWSVTARCDGAD